MEPYGCPEELTGKAALAAFIMHARGSKPSRERLRDAAPGLRCGRKLIEYLFS